MKRVMISDERFIISASKREIAHDIWVILGFTFVWGALFLAGLSWNRLIFRITLLIIVFLLFPFFALLLKELIETLKSKLEFNRQKNQA